MEKKLQKNMLVFNGKRSVYWRLLVVSSLSMIVASMMSVFSLDTRVLSKMDALEDIPSESEMEVLAKNFGLTFYLHQDAVAEDEGEIGQSTLYVKDFKVGKMRKLFQTSPYGKKGTTLQIKKDGCYVDGGIEVVDQVFILTETKLLVSGIPDARNIYSYIYDLTMDRAVLLSAYSGLVDLISEGGKMLLVMGTYRYDMEKGRYGVRVVFDLDGNKIREEAAHEDDEF